MSDPSHLNAGFTRDGDLVVARLAITLDNPVHEVWAALTEPDRLAQWLAPGAIELVEGGRARLDFVDSGIVIDSRVTAVTPQHLLEYSWSGPGEPSRPVRWTLEPVGPLTRLALTLTLPKSDDVARSAAGWAAHLEMLTAFLAGAAMRFPFPTFQAARASYDAQVAGLTGQPLEPAR
ncbi:SRPBCC domain-containing protein [uncultured Phenylobacterium sp.]|uniref:SRPBCC domain-containing protein n=1 Tax=uncultured Phenylobacterium sp. TaxID=349273 RepID=UPI0025E2424A|nr:SRPBCC domain-containing protein [uncultured Phenylobacterium sp.]